ncbi:shikimate kinase [Ferruginibacter sp. HRS2-29]|uniref:shikimate kinase n=1 Tax=Ferruginibacter sp. HRS2-29 TaxID=2487334 RepID=UPI0020CEA104|nr:shikimate kinase [Ferruginibacter sp. HRS2-29]MCP9753274.1 shikimate kinase [Ferruginibacter sp. HRS2-29]
MRIYLLGFMGSGKSHWGKIWAKVHQLEFIDLDKEIEHACGLLIPDIFEKKGEDFFRDMEARMLRATAANDDCIISCGGGAPCFAGNMEWMNANGHTIFLEAPPVYLFENIKKETGTRPLINHMNEAELLFFIEQKLKERMPFYRQAKTTAPAKELTEESFEKIIQQITS